MVLFLFLGLALVLVAEAVRPETIAGQPPRAMAAMGVGGLVVAVEGVAETARIAVLEGLEAMVFLSSSSIIDFLTFNTYILMNQEEEVVKKVWWKSRGFVLALGLVFGAAMYFVVTYNVVNATDVQLGVELAPGLDQVVQLARAGQWAAAATALIGVLLAYFRQQARGPLRF